MESEEYKRMFDVEEHHWWYKGVRLHLRQEIDAVLAGQNARILDAGCGAGGNLAFCLNGNCDSYGVDLCLDALELCRRRTLSNVAMASVNSLPFADESFDCVVSCDVLCCQEVDEPRALGETARVTKKGGFVVLTLPAYQGLMSDHDRAVHCIRRYTATRVRSTITDSSLHIVSIRHLFPLFLPAIAGYRLLRKIKSKLIPSARVVSDVVLPPRFLNGLLYRLVRLDHLVSRHIPLPYGSTLMVVLQRA